MLTRILHVSDLHVGAPKAVTAEWALAPLVDVIVRDKNPAEEETPTVLFPATNEAER